MRQVYRIGILSALACACFAADGAAGGVVDPSPPVPNGAAADTTAQANGAAADATSKSSSVGPALDALGDAVTSLKGDVEDLKSKAATVGVSKDDVDAAIAAALKPVQSALASVQAANDALDKRLKAIEDADLDDRVKKIEGAVAGGAGTGGAGTGSTSLSDFFKGVEMSAEEVVAKVNHIWKQNGNV